MNKGVQCKNCKNHVYPRLWHENMNSLIYHRSNQHICPICGITMYTTGGGLTFIGSLIIYSFIALCIWFGVTALVQNLFSLSNSTSAKVGFFITGIIAALYIAKRFFGFALSSLFKTKKPWQ